MTENRDALRQTHGFFLVVGHVNNGDAKTSMQLTEFILQIFTQFFIQRTQRFVHQQNAWFVDQRPRDGNALLLAAGQLRRAPMSKLFELHQLQHRVDPTFTLGAGQFANRQRERDVVAHRQVREKRVTLEHHTDVAFVRWHVDQ